MLTIRTLEHFPHDKITKVFNESFSDYLVPFKLTREQLENKIKNDGIQLAYSVGAFENDELIGFILHGYDIISDQKVLYNAGTGVIPHHRGNKLTRKLYENIFPLLISHSIDKIQLEVITGNQPAIKTYQDIGFQVKRTLACYRGAINTCEAITGFQIHLLEDYDWELLQSFWDWQPSWQNSIRAAANLKHSNASFGLYSNAMLLGYIILNPLTKRVQQFAVHKDYRRRGIGRSLFHHIAQKFGRDIAIINIDESSNATAAFMISTGLDAYVRQYEMEMKLQ
jgi:ribosomal protein S18 acetylase RimI-like enzyme